MRVCLSLSLSPSFVYLALCFSLASFASVLLYSSEKKSLIKFSSLFLAARIVCMRERKSETKRERGRKREQQQQLRVLTAGRNL